MTGNQSNTVAIFADSANLHSKAMELGRGHFNYDLLIRRCGDFGKVVRMFAYVPNDGFGDGLIKVLNLKGFEVNSKEIDVFIKKDANGRETQRRKGNFDVEIAVDLITEYSNFDTICLITSDGDFSYALKTIRNLERDEILIKRKRKEPRIFHILGFQVSTKFLRMNDSNTIITELGKEFILNVPGKIFTARS